MYLRVVSKPNRGCLKKGFITCPECSEEILWIPSLQAMNEAIENHVKVHKELLKTNSVIMYGKSINIRLDLAQQVLRQISNK
jgi:activator of HSP90 ATPase